MRDILYDIGIAIVITFLAWVGRRVWAVLTQNTDNVKSQCNSKKVRNQFYAFLPVVVVSFVAKNISNSVLINTLAWFSAGFGLMAMAGAFDMIFYMLPDEKRNSVSNNISEKVD